MCGEAFWKRMTAFCLTFGLGFFISNYFILKEMPLEKAQNVMNLVPIRENCVPADEHLKYLHLKEKTEIPKEELEKVEAEKNNAVPKPQLYFPERDLTEYKTLLHKEKCYASDGRK